MKPRKISESAVKRITVEVTEIGGWINARVARLSLVNDWVDDGRTGVDYSAIRRGGAEGSSTERAALTDRADDTGAMASEFMGILERWQRDARRLRYLGVKLLPDWEDPDKRADAESVARRSVEAAGSGDCRICNRLVSGASNDRLKNGRCGACHVYENRYGVERPRHLWGGDSVDRRCVAVRTHHGTDSRCELDVGHDGDHTFNVEAVA